MDFQHRLLIDEALDHDHFRPHRPEAEHGCMTSRGVRAHGSRMVTRAMLGAFQHDAGLRREFLASIGR